MSIAVWSPSVLSNRSVESHQAGLSLPVFLGTTLIAALLLASIVVIPQLLSKQARWEVLRTHVAEIGRLAASTVDGDLHRELLDPATFSGALYQRALKPMVRLHSADPNIAYLYTMVERDGVPHFVLDTAKSPDLRTSRKLIASDYMERFDLREEYEDDWLTQLAEGEVYVTPTYQQDDYGNFLTAHVPIFDSAGRYSGFLGVDFDLQYYFARETTFTALRVGSLMVAALLAVLIGYLAALYHGAMRNRMQTLYDASTQDGLTRLLNRRGAMDAIAKSLARKAPFYAALLIDIDGLKVVNDMRGHTTGDAVIVRVAEAISDSARPGDVCARMGGDEFLVFSACDAEAANELAERILAKLSKPSMPLAGARASVSIGIGVHEGGHADFERMYRDADAALYQARADQKTRIGLHIPSKGKSAQQLGTFSLAP
jgi:diguanylate cyclase (GGDEF)-like protein